MTRTLNTFVLCGVLLTFISGCNKQNTNSQAEGRVQATSATKEYMVTVTRPNTTLHLIDLQQNKVIRQCELAAGPGPGALVMSPDNAIAYVLSGNFSDVYGVNLDNCELVFSTQQASADVRVKSMASLAISPDGTEIYTHQNRVKMMSDHYEMLAPQVAVFDTSAGLKAKPIRTFDGPRQITIMDTLASGELLLGGQDIFQMDVHTGQFEVLLQSLNGTEKGYTPRDVLSVWQTGKINNEFYRTYSRAKFSDEQENPEAAKYLWGYETVNLTTGKVESQDFGPLQSVLFTTIRRPGQLDKVYGTLNELKEFDATTLTELRSLDLEKTYYCINFSHDGSTIYLSGALNDVAVYDADSFEKIANIPLSGDGSLSSSIVFKR